MTDDMESFTPDALIERWMAAYEWANGEKPRYALKYEKGWFVANPLNVARFRVRRREVAGWIVTLENRPKADLRAES